MTGHKTEARRQQNGIFKVLKTNKKHYVTRILCPVKLSFKSKHKIKFEDLKHIPKNVMEFYLSEKKSQQKNWPREKNK